LLAGGQGRRCRHARSRRLGQGLPADGGNIDTPRAHAVAKEATTAAVRFEAGTAPTRLTNTVTAAGTVAGVEVSSGVTANGTAAARHVDVAGEPFGRWMTSPACRP
jgi:hypothetical protein